MAEMSWSNLKTEGNGELTQTLKLQQGQNQMRLVSLPYECHVHWEDTVEGAHKRVVCSGTGCPICNAGHTPQKRFQVLVIDRVDGKVKVLEDGNAIFNQIKFANGALVVNEGDIIANENLHINKNLYINGINFDSYIDDINDAYTMAVNAAPKEHSHSKYTTENEVKTIIKQMVKSSALK